MELRPVNVTQSLSAAASFLAISRRRSLRAWMTACALRRRALSR